MTRAKMTVDYDEAGWTEAGRLKLCCTQIYGRCNGLPVRASLGRLRTFGLPE